MENNKLNKKEKEYFTGVATILNNHFIKNKIKERDEIIQYIVDSSIDYSMSIMINNKFVEFTKDSLIDIVATCNDIEFNYIKVRLNEFIDSNLSDLKDVEYLYERILEEYEKEDYEIDELVKYGRNHYAIKLYTGDNGYLFEFNGSLDKLADYIIDILQETERNLITCPICSHSEPKKDIKEKDNCTGCNAHIIQETYKPNDLRPFMDYFGGELASNYYDDLDNDDYLIWFIKEENYNNFINYTQNKNNKFNFFDKYIQDRSPESSIIISDFSMDNINYLNRSDVISIVQESIAKICIGFCKWVMEKNDDINKYYRIKKFDNMMEWIDNHQERTKYYWHNYNDYDIHNIVPSLVDSRIYEILNVEEYDDLDSEQEDKLNNTEFEVSNILANMTNVINPISAWNIYNYIAIAEIEEKNRKDNERSEMFKIYRETSERITLDYFPELKEVKFLDKKKCKEINFFEKLENIKNCLNDLEIESIINCSLHVITSNSVKYEIQRIVSKK